jgi:hypothetical protein
MDRDNATEVRNASTIDNISGKEFLQNLGKLMDIRLSHLEQELGRTRKIFRSSDRRIMMLTEKIETSKAVVNYIKARLEIEAIKVRQISKNQILLHGRVTDEKFHGIKNLAVSLTAGRMPLAEVGKTDSSGYYSIVLPASMMDKLKEKGVTMYVHHGTVLVYKIPDALWITSRENKYEIVLGKDKIKKISVQKKVKKEPRGTRKK